MYKQTKKLIFDLETYIVMAKHNTLWFASCSRLYRKRDLSGGGSEGREEEGERQEEEEEYSFIPTLFPVLQYKIGSQRRDQEWD